MSDSQKLAFQPPDPAVPIRPVRLSDISALCGCWSDRPYASVNKLVLRSRRFAGQGRGLGVVVADGDDTTIRGFAQLILWPRCGELSDLIVAEAYRGQGLGTAMIQYLVRVACDKHLTCLEIGSALSNTRALALYRRLGFEDSHRLMYSLGNGNEEVLILRLDLPGVLKESRSS